MRLFHAITLITTLAISSVPAHAAKKGQEYFGVSGAVMQLEVDRVGEKLNPMSAVMRFGKHLDNHLALEGRFGLGLDEDEAKGGSIEGEMNYLAGVYMVGQTVYGNNFALYGLMGFTQTEVSQKVAGSREMTADSVGASVGFGMNLGNLKGTYMNLEVMKYTHLQSHTLDAIQLGLTTAF